MSREVQSAIGFETVSRPEAESPVMSGRVEPTAGPGAPSRPEAESPEVSRRVESATKWSLGLFVVVTLGRLMFGAGRRVFNAVPDEPAQLAIARWLSGGTRWTLFDYDTWQPGFAVLLVPAYWVTDDPAWLFRIALAINSVLGGVAAVLLARLLVRLTTIDGRAAHVVALAIALLPASLAASIQVWAEPLITVIVLTGLHLAIRAVDDDATMAGVAGLFVAGAGYLAHGRLLPMLPFALVVLAYVLGRRRRWAAMVAGVMLTAAIFVAVEAFTRWVHANVWSEPGSTNTVGSTLARLGRPAALFDSIVGQIWYLLLASAMFAGVGFVVVVRVAAMGPSGTVMRRRSSAVVVLGLLVPLIGVSMLFMAGRIRADHLIYGRYNEAIIWPVVAIGVVWLLDLAARREWVTAVRWIAGGLGVSFALTAVVAGRSGETLRESRPVHLMISGISAAVEPRGNVAPWPVFGVFAVLAVVVVAAVAGARTYALVSALAIVAVSAGLAARTWVVLGAGNNKFEEAAVVREIDQFVPPGEELGYRFVPIDQPSLVFLYKQREMAQAFQMYLPHHPFAEDEGSGDGVGPYVFAPKSHEPLVEIGAEMLWLDTESGMALWREPAQP